MPGCRHGRSGCRPTDGQTEGRWFVVTPDNRCPAKRVTTGPDLAGMSRISCHGYRFKNVRIDGAPSEVCYPS